MLEVSECVLLGIYGLRPVLAPKKGSQQICFQQLTKGTEIKR